MLKVEVLHCDETYVKVLREKDVSDNSKQYMWVYRTGKHSGRQIVIYDYNKSRSGDVAKKFLGDFNGYLHTDGYTGYNKLTKVTHCNCWAHLRRKFHEAIVVDSEDRANGLDVFKYFELLLTVLPSMAFLTNPDIMKELLPWNESARGSFI